MKTQHIPVTEEKPQITLTQVRAALAKEQALIKSGHITSRTQKRKSRLGQHQDNMKH